MFACNTAVGSYAKGGHPKEKSNMIFSFGLAKDGKEAGKKGSKEHPPSPSSGGPPDTASHVVLSGLQILGDVESVDINPEKTDTPETRSVGFTIDGPGGRILFKCLPSSESSSSGARPLVFQTVDGVPVFNVKTATTTCSSWFKTSEAKLTLPSGGQFGTIVKRASDERKFALTIHLKETEKIVFDVEVLASPSEFLVKQNNEEVAKVTARRVAHRRLHNVSFTKTELSPNVKAMFIVFAMILVQD